MGPTPYHYADGLAALAALSTSATAFSRATSKTDSNGKLYWDEIVIAQGQPDATGAIPAGSWKAWRRMLFYHKLCELIAAKWS